MIKSFQIPEQRIQPLNNKPIRRGDYVLYWMQASHRTEYNHALEYAIELANALKKPLIVFFGLTENYPEAQERHYFFMLEGLREVQTSLEKRGIKFIISRLSPDEGAIQLGRRASAVIIDRGYLRLQRKWRRRVAKHLECLCLMVESDAVVPVEVASNKQEYSAATFRPKIKRKLQEFLLPLQPEPIRLDSLAIELDLEPFSLTDLNKAINSLKIKRMAKKIDFFHGGTSEAKRQLRLFVEKKLESYPDLRNDPTSDYQSHLSPYLHFGQISPLYVALEILKTKSPAADFFLEELIVRRELSLNFVFYNPFYDSFEGLPAWAQKTLLEHQEDQRPYLYSLEELEQAKTHDPYWNAAQMEMRITGKMHGYMRMYWGKKIMEWTSSPQEAFKIALYLNNKYELDGRDPNSFVGVAWCFGLHDRPWAERPIFGKVRYMNDNGLRRKFDADAYGRLIQRLEEKRNK
ncbi:MAG: deoxyribodipyrimidine photo-lyase [Candidatus Aminicenantes bacterium]|nr:deoxyribodipyrimidine photo-lyase [Candidatus Aminicenantes bacterium]